MAVSEWFEHGRSCPRSKSKECNGQWAVQKAAELNAARSQHRARFTTTARNYSYMLVLKCSHLPPLLPPPLAPLLLLLLVLLLHHHHQQQQHHRGFGHLKPRCYNLFVLANTDEKLNRLPL